MEWNLKGKWALITGASSGIGAATSLLLARQGMNVVLLARRKDRLEALAQQIQSDYSQTHSPDMEHPLEPQLIPRPTKPETRIIAVDITDRKAVAKALQDELAVEDLTVLINNAGLAIGKNRLNEANYEDWRIMMDTNVMGLLSVTQCCLPKLLKKPLSQIINVGSVAGRWVYPGWNVYCASKFAVQALSEALRMDLMGKPIRVTNVAPGMVQTEFSTVRLGTQERADEIYKGMTPLTANDVAETIWWCLSRPKHVNIAEVVVYPVDQASVRDVAKSLDEFS